MAGRLLWKGQVAAAVGADPFTTVRARPDTPTMQRRAIADIACLAPRQSTVPTNCNLE